MYIRKIAIGNSEEGYIEDRFVDGFNILYSSDNNKGKTIVIQGILYALGNEPAFPASFNYESYYYILDFQENDKEYSVCRKGTEFILIDSGKIFVFENVSEYKRYWTKNISQLPEITKNGLRRIVDPELYTQLFFVGQDKKETSNITNRGFYNKTDFYNMLFSYAGIGEVILEKEEIDFAKRKVTILEEEKKTLLREFKILKSKKKSVAYLSSIADLDEFGRKLKSIERVQEKITDLKKKRNGCATRKSQWETTIKELRSLNRTIETGELRCMDCDSSNIMYKGKKKDSFSFDVSNIEMRNQIMESIQEKITSYSEEIEKISSELKAQQLLLQDLLEEDEISLETIVAYKSQVIDASDAERRINEINIEIAKLKNSIQVTEQGANDQKIKQEELLSEIYQEMANFYGKVDPSGNLSMDELFTKHGMVYSGSDATMFYLAKMYAYKMILEHSFPVIIDSFRAEDLSTDKEDVVLKLYNNIVGQIIFTTTLKNEEKDKYMYYKQINRIDFSGNESSHIISNKNSKAMKKNLERFYI